MNGKQFYSWKDVKDANNQVAIILKQNEKEREIGRSEMLNLVRKACWYDRDDSIRIRTDYKEFKYFREHSGWKFLSQKEQSAVDAIYRVLNGKIRFSKDLKTNLRDRKIHSWEDVIDIHDEILEKEEVNAKEENARAEAKADAEKAKAKAKAEILELVQKKKLNECRSHPGWKKYLTNEERLAVESILNLGIYKGAYRNRVKRYVSTLKITTWNDIIQARREIIKIGNLK